YRLRHRLRDGAWPHDVEAMAVAKDRLLERLPRAASFNQVRSELDQHRCPPVHGPLRTVKDVALRSLRLQPDQRGCGIERRNHVVISCRGELDGPTRRFPLQTSWSTAVETVISGVVG